MNTILKSALAITGLIIATQAVAQVTFYENDGFQGRSFSTEKKINNFERYGFNDRASSVVVSNDRWEVCEDARFRGRCIILRPGRYPSLASMGMNNRISSVRNVRPNDRFEENRFAPLPLADNDYHRRGYEKTFEANVTSVHAVVGPTEQRCWVDREQVVVHDKGDANVPGAIVGAVIGGILGHQVGGGRGKDVATVGGVAAGAAVGANVGRDNNESVRTQDVKRCANVPNQARPEYWDVTYQFRNQEHRVQVTTPPGPTILVNEFGEPRT